MSLERAASGVGLISRSTAARPEAIDFLIVTVLDSEFEAVRRHVPGLTPEMNQDDPIVYLRGHLPTAQGEAYSVVLMQLFGMGNPGAAVAVTTALHRFAPRSIVVVGIAGGVPGELDRGDVAVSRDLVYYESGKMYERGLEHRAAPVRAQPLLASFARYFAESDWHAKIAASRPGSARQAGFPHVKVGTIASGEKVVDSAPFIAALKKQYKNLIAVAMEGSGAASPAAYFGARAGDVVEVRGIADLADGTKDDEWQPYAADVAAAFTAAFLASGPLSSAQTRQKSAPSFVAVRMQSMAPVNPSEVEQLLLAGGASGVSDVPIDLLSFARVGGKMRDAAGAVSLLGDENGAYLRALARGGQERVLVYGHTHIPLAVLAGAIATDRFPIDLLDYHRGADPPGWTWPSRPDADFPALTTAVRAFEHGTPDAVLRVSVSYPVSTERTRAVVPDPVVDYELRIVDPTLGVVVCERQARAYAAQVRAALDALSTDPRRPERIHLFYAGPISVALAIGQAYSPTIHPTLIAWNHRADAYDWGVNITKALDGEAAVVSPEHFRAEGA